MAIPLGSFQQGSRETLDYSIDWSALLTAESDTAASASWVAESGSPTIGNGSNGAPAASLAANKATVWIVGGTAGNTYTLSCVLTTTGQRKFEASILVTIIDR